MKTDGSDDVRYLMWCLAAVGLFILATVTPTLVLTAMFFGLGWLYGDARRATIEAENRKVANPFGEVSFDGKLGTDPANTIKKAAENVRRPTQQ